MPTYRCSSVIALLRTLVVLLVCMYGIYCCFYAKAHCPQCIFCVFLHSCHRYQYFVIDYI